MGNEASRICKLAKFTRIQKFRGSSNATVNHMKANSFQQVMPGNNLNGSSGAASSQGEEGTPLAQAAAPLPGDAAASEGTEVTAAAPGGGDGDGASPPPPADANGGEGGGQGCPAAKRPAVEHGPQMKQFHSEEDTHPHAHRRVIGDGETKHMRRQFSSRSSGVGGNLDRQSSSGRKSDKVQACTSKALKNDTRTGGATGRPFPKRPIGSKLSTKTWARLEELFRLMDQDGSNAVTREEAKTFFSGAFSNLSVDAMFNEVDTDGSGAITSEEFVKFWLQVRSSGYKEQDILDEVGELIEGGAWVDWKDGRDTVAHEVKFPKRPVLCRLSAKAWGKCEELFHKMSNNDEKMQITRDKAQVFFKGAFCNISADAMFNEIDVNHHGVITPKEFMRFWVQLKSFGYKEKEILEELDNLMEGSPWVDWKDGRRT